LQQGKVEPSAEFRANFICPTCRLKSDLAELRPPFSDS
jgi:hypothetical protein